MDGWKTTEFQPGAGRCGCCFSLIAGIQGDARCQSLSVVCQAAAADRGNRRVTLRVDRPGRGRPKEFWLFV